RAARSTRATPATSRTRPRPGAPGSTGRRAPAAGSFWESRLAAADLAAFGEVGRALGAAQGLRRRPGAAGVARALDRILDQGPAGGAARRRARGARRADGERGLLQADTGLLARSGNAHAVGPGPLVFVARGLGAAVAEVPRDWDAAAVAGVDRRAAGEIHERRPLDRNRDHHVAAFAREHLHRHAVEARRRRARPGPGEEREQGRTPHQRPLGLRRFGFSRSMSACTWSRLRS